MDFFGWPVAPVAAALVALTLGGALPLVARGGFLVRLGARNVPRRRVRAALIVFGLTLSTTVLGAAFGTGDTITYTLRALVTESLGTVDEVIVINPPRSGDTERARALLQGGGTFGGLQASDLGFFPQREADRLRGATRDSRAIAATCVTIDGVRAAIASLSRVASASPRTCDSGKKPSSAAAR